jgi:hypothetical protein
MRPYRLSLLTALFPGVFSIGSAQVGGAKHEARTRTSGHFTIRPDSVPWGVPPAVMFTGSPSEGAGGQWRYALLQGDPMKPGAPFTIRFSCGDGDKASPAWHPTDENFVVLKGTFGIAPVTSSNRPPCATLPQAPTDSCRSACTILGSARANQRCWCTVSAPSG